MKEQVRASLLSALLIAASTLAFGMFMQLHPSYRVALIRAGDFALPGAMSFQDLVEIHKVISQMGDVGRAAYIDLLHMDDRFLVLVFTLLLSIAWILGQNLSRKWPIVIAALATAYVSADWLENRLLMKLFTEPHEAELAGWSVFASTVKWTALAGCALVGALGLLRCIGTRQAWWLAFFQDVPYILDSLSRRTEFLINREFIYFPASATQPAHSAPKSCWRKPPFLFFCITFGFVAYGPTLDGICSIAPQPWPRMLPLFAGVAAAWFLWWTTRRLTASIKRGINGRFDALSKYAEHSDLTLLAQRKDITKATIALGAGLLLVPLVAATVALLAPPIAQPGTCSEAEFSLPSLLRFAVWFGSVFALALVWRATSATSKLLWAQALIISGVGGILWFSLATPVAKEADGLPYRHVFGALGPAVLFSLVLAPPIGLLIFRPPRWVPTLIRPTALSRRTRSFFRYLLSRRELFVARAKETPPAPSRILFALIQGISYRTLQLALPPALLAFVAPAEWLGPLTWYGVAVSVLLSAWGNMSSRWQQMTRLIDRWFLTGTALFVSMFVIIVALLRVLDVDYITTILDAAPFGISFAVVVMSYVLSWLVEYWINRILAVELLSILGGDPVEPKMRYPVTFNPIPAIRVAPQGRELSYHSIGRFLVVGTLVPPHQPVGNAPAGSTAFHTYDLMELFRTLARRDNDHVAELIRYSTLYFYAMNAVLAVVFVSFGIAYWHLSREAPEIVVSVSEETDDRRRKDLAAWLIAKPGETRPAIVVVASGGGTRAALYASHVLQGLHNLGADRDIVLTSGVSGGGVALAYFAAHYQELVEANTGNAARWEQFRREISSNLIGHVLEGASEWRIFGATPLTVLLAESFGRHLGAMRSATMRLPEAPALILNTTITGHPAEDSELLIKTLDPVTGLSDEACREAARPYKMMNGGRLIFTNLQDIGAFPDRKSEIPDTRLPYWVVNDLDVPLARAAALNANFPPVFPNARIEIRGWKGTACRERSYFVTDGGAQENLGLLSALFAVQSALQQVERTCKKRVQSADGACHLRPLHFVIAEASAAAYDYEQDRGISAGVAGAKERMTGGLTSVLIGRTREMYVSKGGNADNVRFHYLPLPLAFRARGGFGTHWMAAGKFYVQDPRPRSRPEIFAAKQSSHLFTASISKLEIDDLWLTLHDAATPYCSNSAGGSLVTDKVKRWICGMPGDSNSPRDWHVDAWQNLINELR